MKRVPQGPLGRAAIAARHEAAGQRQPAVDAGRIDRHQLARGVERRALVAVGQLQRRERPQSDVVVDVAGQDPFEPGARLPPPADPGQRIEIDRLGIGGGRAVVVRRIAEQRQRRLRHADGVEITAVGNALLRPGSQGQPAGERDRLGPLPALLPRRQDRPDQVGRGRRLELLQRDRAGGGDVADAQCGIDRRQGHRPVGRFDRQDALPQRRHRLPLVVQAVQGDERAERHGVVGLLRHLLFEQGDRRVPLAEADQRPGLDDLAVGLERRTGQDGVRLLVGRSEILALERDQRPGELDQRIAGGEQVELAGAVLGFLEAAAFQRDAGQEANHLRIAAIKFVGAGEGVKGLADVVQLILDLAQRDPVGRHVLVRGDQRQQRFA